MVGLGMLIHFGITLWKFLSTKVVVGTIDLSWPSLLAPALVAGFGVIYICLLYDAAAGRVWGHACPRLREVAYCGRRPPQARRDVCKQLACR